MLTFVVPDIHGHVEQLRSLLFRAGCIDENDERVAVIFAYTSEHGSPYQVVSIGDLANAVLKDVNGDEACLLKARDWFDLLILGNHESGYLFDNIGFNGFVPTPHLKSLYISLHRDGLVVPGLIVGDTLLTHAGVQNFYNFTTPQEAFDAISDVWDNYRDYRNDYSKKFVFDEGRTEIPKALLLDGVAQSRGGNSPMGGILWSDWGEQKNVNFSQVVGHSPRPGIGPVLHEYKGTGVFHLNIDCGAKHAESAAVGVWLDSDGRVLNFVSC